MRVALLVPSIGLGDEIETPAVRLFAEMVARDVDLHVFPLFVPAGAATVRHHDITLHPATASKDRFARRAARTVAAVRREHTRSPFDLVHALWLHEPGTIAVTLGTLLRVPVVVSIGGAEVVALPEIAYGALRQPRGRLMTANVLQRATIVTGGSEYVLRQARRLVPHRDPGRFRRVPLPVDAEQYSPSEGRTFDTVSPRLLHAASLIPVKDQVTLLRAFRRVLDVIPGARLTVAGGDPFGIRRDLEQLAEDMRLGASVSFAGPVPHDAMPAIYAAADLFVLSSLHESQSMVVLEAAAAGVPTVGTTVGVVPELATEAAVAVRPGDSIALANAVIELVTDPARLARMGRLARERVLAEYDAPAVRDLILIHYHDAIRLGRR